jgi:hypothetical protein
MRIGTSRVEVVTELVAERCPTPRELALCVPGLESSIRVAQSEMSTTVTIDVGDQVVRRSVRVAIQETIDGGWLARWHTDEPTDVLRSLEVRLTSVPRSAESRRAAVTVTVRADTSGADALQSRRAHVLLNRIVGQAARNIEALLVESASPRPAAPTPSARHDHAQQETRGADQVARTAPPSSTKRITAALMVPVLAAAAGWLWRHRGRRRP